MGLKRNLKWHRIRMGGGLSENESKYNTTITIENDICHIDISGGMVRQNDLSQFNITYCQENVTRYIFNLNDLNDIDSYGAGLLIWLLMEIKDRKGKCVAFGANEMVKELIECLQLGELFPIYQTESEAMSALTG